MLEITSRTWRPPTSPQWTMLSTAEAAKTSTAAATASARPWELLLAEDRNGESKADGAFVDRNGRELGELCFQFLDFVGRNFTLDGFAPEADFLVGLDADTDKDSLGARLRVVGHEFAGDSGDFID